jgi:hypothetical protein
MESGKDAPGIAYAMGNKSHPNSREETKHAVLHQSTFTCCPFAIQLLSANLRFRHNDAQGLATAELRA